MTERERESLRGGGGGGGGRAKGGEGRDERGGGEGGGKGEEDEKDKKMKRIKRGAEGQKNGKQSIILERTRENKKSWGNCKFGSQENTVCSFGIILRRNERWGAGVETQKNVRGEIWGWGRVPFNEPYAPLLSTIYDGA